MKSDFLIISIIILVILISGCTQTGYVVSPEGYNASNTTTMNNINSAITTTTIVSTTTTTVQIKHCPATCSDNNSCTEDKCSAATNYECAYKAIIPCCGNGVCEDNEFNCNEDCIINISIIYIHYEDPEWVEIKNNGNAANLTGWTLEDLANHIYTFLNFILYSNSTVTIHTESGSNNQTDLYWNRSASVWNNQGDNATLKDSKGNIISKYSYPLTTNTTTTTTSSTTTTTPTTTTMPTTTTSSIISSSTTTTTETSTTTTATSSTTTTTQVIDHLLISEVYYDAIGDEYKREWVELYNPTPDNIALDNYSLWSNDGNWIFPKNIVIFGYNYTTIARNRTGFFELYACYPNVDGLDIMLNNDGDYINLTNGNQPVDFVAWENCATCPEEWKNIYANENKSISRNLSIYTGNFTDWLNNQIPTPVCA